jgi:hypothetical protein
VDQPAASKSVKLSHSLRPETVERLKDLAYWERVSESAIVEFVLGEFFSLGDNGALGTVVRESIGARRRHRFAAHLTAVDSGPTNLLGQLTAARRSFSDAVDAWRQQTTLANFNRVGVTRLELSAVSTKVADAGIVAVAEGV